MALIAEITAETQLSLDHPNKFFLPAYHGKVYLGCELATANLDMVWE